MLIEHRMWKAHGEDLVRTDGAIRTVVAHYVVEAPVLFVPEYFAEPGLRAIRQSGIMRGLGAIGKARGQPFHHTQRVVPECLNLHRLTGARSYYPIRDPGVHPGELHTRFARA